MSQINFYSDEYNYGEIFPNISLVILKNVKAGYIAENKIEAEENCIGLIIYNDPFIIINKKAINNKYFYYSDNDINDLSQEDFSELLKIYDEQNTWNNLINGEALSMWKLVNSVKEAGYVEGHLGAWINQKVAEFLEIHKPIEIYKKF